MRERGSAPLELAIGVLTLLLPAALLVLSFGPWLERRTFVRAAAAETARYLVLHDGEEPPARSYLAALASNNGIDPTVVSIGLCGPPEPLNEPPSSTCEGRGRGETLEVTVTVGVPGIVTPFGTVGSVRAGYTHVELVDLYRSMP